MKKFWAFALSVAMLLSMTACGGKKDKDEDPISTGNVIEVTPDSQESVPVVAASTPTPEPTPTPKPEYRLQSVMGFNGDYALIRFYDEANSTYCSGLIDTKGKLQYYVADSNADESRSRNGYLYLQKNHALHMVTPKGKLVTFGLGENLTLMTMGDGYAVIQEYKSGFDAVEYVYHIYNDAGKELTAYSSGSKRAYNLYNVGEGTFLFMVDKQGDERNAYGYSAIYADIYFAESNTWLKDQVVTTNYAFSEYSYRDGVFLFRAASNKKNDQNTHKGEFTYTDNKGNVKSFTVPGEIAQAPKYYGHSNGSMLIVDGNENNRVLLYDMKADTWASYEGQYVDRMLDPNYTAPVLGDGNVAIALRGADSKSYTMLLGKNMEEVLDAPVLGTPYAIRDGKLLTLDSGILYVYDLKGKQVNTMERFDSYANQSARTILVGGQNEYFTLEGKAAFDEITFSTGKQVNLPEN